MKLIFSYIRRHALLYVVGIVFLTVEALADLLQPTFMSYIVNDGVQQKDMRQILIYGAIMLGIALVGAGAAIARNILSCRASQAIGSELRSDMYRKVQDLSFENIDRLQPASIITRLTNDVTVVTNFSASLMRIAVKVPITAIGAFALLVMQAPQQLPVILVIIVVVGWLISLTMRLSRPRFARMQRAMDRLNNVSREWLSSVRAVKAFGAEPRERQRFSDAAENVAAASISASRVPATFVPLINLVANLGIVVLLWRSQTHNAAEIGNLMAAVNYMTQLVMSLGMINMVLNEAVRAVTSSSRIGEVLDERPAQPQSPDPVPLDPTGPQGSVRFEDVSFAYAGSARPALQAISLAAEPGQTIGIIGPTGSGKSTLVSLVPRFYDATEGRVLVGDVDVTTADERQLRQAVAMVPQRPLLFSGSITDNLRWGDEHATDEEMRRAARIACADEFIDRLPDGYDTQLGQGGVNLSGGQKQRLCIARALLRKPRVLILDDCTSALDGATEAAVLRSLRELAGGVTLLLISQRISTVRRADAILCLEDGRMQGFGTHDELMQSSPTYRAIYDSQTGGAHVGSTQLA